MKNKGEEIIQLKNVTKYYKMGESIVKALDGLNLKIKKGEFVAIMGPSGSGKSTAMNLVGSLDVPTRGAIYLDGYDISHLEESDLAQIRGKKVGFIFQQFNLIPNLTVLENVMLPMMFQGTDRMEREEYAMELLRKVDLGDRADHYPNQISGGQMQRVAIARALANDPEVILADEPTGNLDKQNTTNVINIIKDLVKQYKISFVIATHNLSITKKFDKIIKLSEGKIV